MTLNDLNKNLYSIEDQPDCIPYVTSYYKERWGFCLSHNLRKSLKNDTYHAVIKSELKDGVLNYGELIIKGKSKKSSFIDLYMSSFNG